MTIINKEKQSLLNATIIRNLLNYDPETGLFTWITGQRCGMKAGWNDRGYVCITIKGTTFRAHRLAWLWMTGQWPIDQIDHINGNKSENQWVNLREANYSINRENQYKPRKNSQTGFLGVIFRKDRQHTSKPWRAKITTSGKREYLGYFATPQEAHEAYLKAKRKLHKGAAFVNESALI